MNMRLVGFIKNLSSNSISVILTCKLQLNRRDLFTTCHSYYVIKLLSKFPLVKNGKNRPRNVKVIVENKEALFFPHTVYISSLRTNRDIDINVYVSYDFQVTRHIISLSNRGKYRIHCASFVIYDFNNNNNNYSDQVRQVGCYSRLLPICH